MLEKLLWFNRHYIKTLDPEVIAERVVVVHAKTLVST